MHFIVDAFKISNKSRGITWNSSCISAEVVCVCFFCLAQRLHCMCVQYTRSYLFWYNVFYDGDYINLFHLLFLLDAHNPRSAHQALFLRHWPWPWDGTGQRALLKQGSALYDGKEGIHTDANLKLELAGSGANWALMKCDVLITRNASSSSVVFPSHWYL